MKITNLKIYFVLVLFNNFWFITSNWLNFWLKYMTLKEVGIIDAIAFMVGILLEFPSGIISDKLGRKQTLLISQSLQFLGSVIITISSSVLEIGIGFVIFQIGVAFYSGTVEAFGYESSVLETKDYTKILILSTYLTNFAYLSSLIIGGYLYLIDSAIPNTLFALNFLIGYIASIFIQTYGQKSIPEDSSNNDINYRKFNVFTLFLFVSLMAITFSFDYGFLKLVILEKFSSLDNNYFYIFFATILSIPVSNWFLTKFKSYNRVLVLCFLSVGISFILFNYSAIPLFCILSFLTIFIYQISLKYLNDKVNDFQRARVISLFNLCYKLPYVLIALILGYNLA